MKLMMLVASLVADAPPPRPSAQPAIDLKRQHTKVRFAPKEEWRPIPFELRGGTFVFRVRLKDRDVWAILDNGMGRSVIDLRLARELGVEVSEPLEPLRTPTGTLEQRRTSSLSYSFPTVMEVTTSMSAADLTFPSRATGRTIGMMIGRDLIGHLALSISNRDGTFRVGPSGTLKVPEQVPVIPIRGDQQKLDLTIDGKPFTLALDLGNNSGITLDAASWDQLENLSDVRDGAFANLQGTVRQSLRGTAAQVKIGPLTLKDVAIQKWPDDVVLPPAHVYSGLLGMGILRRFDFAIDIKAGKLWLMGTPIGPTHP